MVLGKNSSLKSWAKITPPDIYFSLEYHQASAVLEPDCTELTLLEWSDNHGQVYLPLVLREIFGQQYYDATNAYGHGGPWIEGQPDTRTFRMFYEDWAKQHNVVATFLQFHPVYDFATAMAEAFPLQKTGETVMWNLAAEDLVAQMSSNHRRNWRKALKSGITLNIIQAPEDLSVFRKLYELSMNRLGVQAFYHFPDAYWTALHDKLGEHLLQVDAIYEGQPVSSVLCILGRDMLHFHLNGATDQGRELRGPFAAHVGAAHWGQEHGYTRGHLGGSASESLLDFKSRFDPDTPHRDFYVTQITHDKTQFETLAQGLPATRYFPPWRDPQVTGA